MAATLLFDGAPEPPRPGEVDPGSAPPAPTFAGGGPAALGRNSPWILPVDRPSSRAVNVGLLALLAAPVAAHLAGVPWRPTAWLFVLLSSLVLVQAMPTRVAAGSRCGAPARRLGRRPHVFIVGDDDFCRSIAHGAAEAGRRVSGEWAFDPSSDGPAPAISPFDEVVVDARCFAGLREQAPAIFEGTNRVRVVTERRPDRRILDHPLGPAARACKRAFDIIIAFAALMITLPSLLAAMVAIRLDSQGPALFKQQRVGEGGRRFTLYKLRTMTVGEEDPSVLAYMADMVRCQATAENGMFKLGSNRRITRIGRTLRRYSIDEIPQLINVLKGDMSLIGPRPPIVEEAACYTAFHWQRLAVRPGITGLAQVNGRSRLRFDDIVTLDVRYSRSWSALLELKILLRTPAAVLSGRGAT